MDVHLTWNLVSDFRQLLEFHFMVNALRAGTIVAVVAGAIGYFMVLRRETFAGHTLALIGFPGAAAATWLGIDPATGFFAFCILGALAIGASPVASSARGQGQRSALIGTVQAFALASGLLFISLYAGFLSALNSLLFGTVVGVTDGQVRALLIAGGCAVVALVVIGRPLLFATVDAEVARARGVRVRAVGLAFLVLLGVAAAGTSQVTGSLLVFALLVAPAATAVRVTARPVAGVTVSIVVAVGVTWLGEGVAYFSPYPVGFWVTTFAFALFLAATLYQRVRARC